ncbi:MAG: acetylornithine transaminase [bacterium]|nr:acetylornithine transaminase [bacterium]
MEKNDELIKEEESKYILQTYRRYPISLVKGKGAFVWDASGKKYLDFIAGLAVCNLGHSHPKIVDILKKQATTLIHTSNLFYTIPQINLAKKLIELSFSGKVFFCNSGAEANEAAIKLARKYGKKVGDKYEIITMENSFHGRTLATLTATGQTKFQKGFDPLPEGFKYCKFNDIEDFKKKITLNTVAVIIEPIQGEGGVNIAKAEYLASIRDICNKQNILLIFDEVQTGIGRTGEMFAFQNYHDLTPDVMTLAKALGSGFPIGAMVVSDKFSDYLSFGDHASTFGGNPLAAATGCATLDVIKEENILEKVKRVGASFLIQLNTLAKKYSFVKEVRGQGLMIAMELTIDGDRIVKKCVQEGLLINCTCGNILRILPPLIISNNEIEKALEILDNVLGNIDN